MEEPSEPLATLSLESFAAINAALEAGAPRAKVLGEAGLSDEGWSLAQERCLGALAQQASAGRLAEARRYVEARVAEQPRAAQAAEGTRPPAEGPMPAPPAPAILPFVAGRGEEGASGPEAGRLDAPSATRPRSSSPPAMPSPLPPAPMVAPPPVIAPPVIAPPPAMVAQGSAGSPNAEPAQPPRRDRTALGTTPSPFAAQALPFAATAPGKATSPGDAPRASGVPDTAPRASVPAAPPRPSLRRGSNASDPLQQTAPPAAMSPFAQPALPFGAPDRKTPTPPAPTPVANPLASTVFLATSPIPEGDALPFAHAPAPSVATPPLAPPAPPAGRSALPFEAPNRKTPTPPAPTPPKPPADPHESTVFLATSPIPEGDALPFAHPPAHTPVPAPPPGADPHESTVFLATSPIPEGDALPFAHPSATSPTRPPPTTPPAEPPHAGPPRPSVDPPTAPIQRSASRASAVLPFTPAAGKPAEPKAQATAAARVEGISLAQYAQICAEVRAWPAHVDRIRGHYGLDNEAWKALHTLWYARFDHDPPLRARFQSLVEQRLARLQQGQR